MNDHVGVGTARGANFMMFQWSYSLVKRKLQHLQDAIFPITGERKISMEEKKVLHTMHDHALVDMNVPVFALVVNGKMVNEFETKESILTKKKICSRKPNKRIDPIFNIILHLLYFNSINTDKNQVILLWMASLIKVEDSTLTIDEDNVKGADPSETEGGGPARAGAKPHGFQQNDPLIN